MGELPRKAIVPRRIPAVGGPMSSSPSPSDLLWVMGLTPQGRWIVPVVREAVRAEWAVAQQIARALARELMESAIEQTHEYLADQLPVTVDEAHKVLNLHYRNGVRRHK